MCKHHLYFYEDHFPAQRVSDFLVEGLVAGDSVLLILTQANRQAVEHCLRASGLRFEDACVFVDTHQALAQLRASGGLNLRLAREILTPLMGPVACGALQRVRTVGDLAPMLCAMGALPVQSGHGLSD